MGYAVEQQLPQPLLDQPQVGRLAGEGGAVDPPQGGKPAGVVTPAVLIDPHVLVIPQELPDHLHGQHLSVIQVRCGTAGPHPAPVRMSAQLAQQFIDQAIDGYHELFQVHGAPP
jgi:hypothetical protein